MESSEEQLALELKRAMENKDFQVITFTRPQGNWVPFLLNEVQNIFREICSFFGKNADVLANEWNEDLAILMKKLFDLRLKYTLRTEERHFITEAKIRKNTMEMLREIRKDFRWTDLQNYANEQSTDPRTKDTIIKRLLREFKGIKKKFDDINYTNLSKYIQLKEKLETLESDIQGYYIDVLATIAKNSGRVIKSSNICNYLNASPVQKIGVLPQKFDPQKWTFLIIQEMFFSQTHALDNFTVDKIIKYCCDITKLCPKISVSS
jgi:hypothetical protein